MGDELDDVAAAARAIARRFDEAASGDGATFDGLAELAGETPDGGSSLMKWIGLRQADGSLERVNGEPEADGSLVNPALFRRTGE